MRWHIRTPGALVDVPDVVNSSAQDTQESCAAVDDIFRAGYGNDVDSRPVMERQDTVVEEHFGDKGLARHFMEMTPALWPVIRPKNSGRRRVDLRNVTTSFGNEIIHHDVNLAGVGEGKDCFLQQFPGLFQRQLKGHDGAQADRGEALIRLFQNFV